MPRPRRPADLRRACLDEARRIVREDGPERLSLRTVARRLGVSHQAPYKHFASKDEVIAELVRQAFDDFARHLEYPSRAADLRSIGRAYVHYALQNPSEYRLMFGTPLPPPGTLPEMTAHSRAAVELLEDALIRLRGAQDAEQDAVFVWSTLHGLSTLLLGAEDAEGLLEHALDRVDAALEVRR